MRPRQHKRGPSDTLGGPGDLMTREAARRRAHRAAVLAAAFASSGLLSNPASAQTDVIATAPRPAAPGKETKAQPSEIMAVNLIRLMVKRGMITQDDADGLVQQAQDEARQARVDAERQLSALPPPAPGTIRVPYVPEIVRDQIRDEVKQDVLARAKSEGWASPGQVPEWVSRIRWSGDFRFRDQSNLYSPYNLAPYIDYATFNAAGPTDINPNTNPNGLPFLDTRTNRLNQLNIRARLAMTASVFKGVTTTIRLASGSDDGPVSTTQILGGGLTKKDIWLDQAFVRLDPVDWGSLMFGRMPDPFMHTDILFGDNLNFDGAEGTFATTLGGNGLSVFGTLGAFPLNYQPNNFPIENGIKSVDRTQWLLAAQGGAEYKPDASSWSIRGAFSFYSFENVRGVLSQPCPLFEGINQCSSDATRPSYMQKGNTLFLLRDIIPNPASPLNYAQPQFLGLSYNYNVIDATGELETPLFGATRLQLQADYARNLAFDPASVVNNFDATSGGGVGPYHSGPNAWLVKATIGHPRPGTPGDWNFVAGYKYIEPDAVMDAYNDYDFHLGGTNAKGYFLSASYYFAGNTSITGRWFSANEVFGPPLAIDVLMFDLNTSF